MRARSTRGGVVLALGLGRPHLPTLVRQKWFDYYPERVEVPAGYWPGSTTPEGNLPDQADLGRTGAGGRPDKIADRLDRAWRTERLPSRLLCRNVVRRRRDRPRARCGGARNLWGNTYVVVTSDHGFMLGEKRQFSKFALREVALQVPLFVAGAGIDARCVASPISLIDLYPTICSLAGLPMPAHCEGQDLTPTVRAAEPPPRGHAISYYGGRRRNEVSQTETFQLHASVRTAQWRLIDYGPAAISCGGWSSSATAKRSSTIITRTAPATIRTSGTTSWRNGRRRRRAARHAAPADGL